MAKKVKEAYEGDKAAEAVSSNLAEESDEAEAQTENVDAGSESGGDETSPLAQLEKALKELDEERAKSEDMQKRYLRSIADLENFRRRAIKDKEELSKHAISDFADALLPVLDNFKLGMTAAEQHPEASVVAEGFKMVQVQLVSVLKDKGIEEIVPDGEEFDPQFHEGVSHLPHDEVPENCVIETIRSGYRFKDKLIRAATVVVSSGPSS